MTSLRTGTRYASVLVLVLSSTGSTFAQQTPAPQKGSSPVSSDEDRETSAQAPTRPAEMPLALLPDPPSLTLADPRPASLEAIDDLLARISAEDPVLRERAHRELLEVKPDWVSGLSRRLDRIAERSDKNAMRGTLEKIRSKAKKSPKNEEAETSANDYLVYVLDSPEPSAAPWRDLTQILSISRMLRHIGTTEAVRELIRIYVRFGEFLRIDTQLQLEQLGDRAIAGLLEAQRHPAQKIASWAQKQLDLRGKAIPHEAVRTQDPVALADILVALGRSRDPDAARILISFASTERSQIRTAARQGIALLGEVAAWQLRDAYLDTTGKQPAREWTWKRTARELFTEYDRLRSAKVFELFEQARKAEQEGDLTKMREGYDQVLALSPLFEQRELMVPGYLRVAEQERESSPELTLSALRKIERLSADENERRRAESLRYVLEAERLEARGLIDRGLLDKAIALDPGSDSAEAAIERTAQSNATLSTTTRYLLAGAILLLSLLGAAAIGWQAFWRRKQVPPLNAPSPATPPETTGAHPDEEELLPPSHPQDPIDDDESLPASSSPEASTQIEEAPPSSSEH